MTIEYVGGLCAGRVGSTSTTTQSLSGTLTGGLASSPSEGDLVIVTMVVGSSGRNPATDITTPTGYTALGALLANGTYDTSMNVSYKFMPATPDANFTVPSTGAITDAQRWTVQVFRGVDPTTPLDVTPVPATGTASGNCDPASITPSTAGAWVVICGGGANNVGVAYTGPTNYTTNFLTGVSYDGIDAMVGSGYYAGWTSGAENPGAYTDNAASSWGAYTIALRPYVAPPLDITGILGTATASGYTAAVDRQYQVNGILGSASASGFLAEITSANNITGILGTAVASGYTAAVDRQLGVTGTLGTATASGTPAQIDQGTFDTLTVIGSSPNISAFGHCASHNIFYSFSHWSFAYLNTDVGTPSRPRGLLIDPDTGIAGTEQVLPQSTNTRSRGYQWSLHGNTGFYAFTTFYAGNELSCFVKAPGTFNTLYAGDAIQYGELVCTSAIPDGFSESGGNSYRSHTMTYDTKLHVAFYKGAWATLEYGRTSGLSVIGNAEFTDTRKTITGGSSGCSIKAYDVFGTRQGAAESNAGDLCLFYTDDCAGSYTNYSLNMQYYDASASTWSAEQIIAASGVLYLAAFSSSIFVDGSTVVFWLETGSVLKYAIRSAGASGTWGTAVSIGTIGWDNVTCTCNSAHDNQVVFYYVNASGDIVFNTITDGTLGSPTVLVRDPGTLIGIYDFNAPERSVGKFGLVYHLATGVIKFAAHTLADPPERGVQGTLLSKEGYGISSVSSYGDFEVYAWSGTDHKAHAALYKKSTNEILIHDTIISQDYFDIHNEIYTGISSNGVLYIATGGRYINSIGSYPTIVNKFTYAVDSASFSFSARTEIHNAIFGARGYKFMTVDDSNVLHLMVVASPTDVEAHGSSMWVKNYDPIAETWSSNHLVYSMTPPAGGPANNSYTNHLVLGTETSGQKSLHFFVTYGDAAINTDAAGGMYNSIALYYLKLMYQPATRNYKAYKADATELTVPATTSTIDVVFNYATAPATEFPGIRGGTAVLSDVPIHVHNMYNQTTKAFSGVRCRKYVSGTGWVESVVAAAGDNNEWHAQSLFTYGGKLYFVCSAPSAVDGILDVYIYISANAGDTWSSKSIKIEEGYNAYSKVKDQGILYQIRTSLLTNEIRRMDRFDFLAAWASNANTLLKRA